MVTVSDLRPSLIVGTWYSGSADQLARQVDDYIQQATLPDLNGEVMGLVAPHAGHRYSGRTAGHAYRSVLGKTFDLVVVVSPMHIYSPVPLLTSAHRAYQTPLGAMWIDQDAQMSLQQNLKDAGLQLRVVANDHEHSLEIELPFLQRALQGEFKLLPLMLHTRSAEISRHVGSALAKTLSGKNVLLVSSTDLSHFTPLETARQLDGEMLRCMASFSPQAVLEADQIGSGAACGAAAVASVFWAARELGANAVEIVHYSTSGEETGDFSSVVGYGAAVIMKRP